MSEAAGERLIPVAVPSDRCWFDPPLILSNLYFSTRTIILAAATETVIAPNNPYRWAIGFVSQVFGGDRPVCAPYANAAVLGGWPTTPDVPLWFRMPDFGPLVMSQWSATCAGGGYVVVIEVIRQSNWSQNAMQSSSEKR